MSAIREFRRKLAAGEPCVGPSITFSDPLISEALSPSADFLWIDTEHTPLGREAVVSHLLAAKACNTPALVRVPTSDRGNIKPLLDCGVDGIIVPQIRSANEAATVVDNCRYPPGGKRGFGPRRPMNYGRSTLSDYLRDVDRDLFVSVQIECVEALAEIDDIVAIDGLDSVVLGPMDLSGALGCLGQMEHPELIEAMETVIAAGQRTKLPVGIGMGADQDLARSWIAKGVSWVQLGCDFEYLVRDTDTLFAPWRPKTRRGTRA